MSSTYTGDPAGATVDPIEISVPADGEGLNVSSILDSIETLADYVAYLQQAAGHTAWLDQGAQEFADPVDFADSVHIQAGVHLDGTELHLSPVPTSDSTPILLKKWLADDYSTASDRYFRIYIAGSSLWFLYNTEWDSGASKWKQDDAAAESGGFLLGTTQGGFLRQTAGHAPWTIADWGIGSIVGAGKVQAIDPISSATAGGGQAVAPGDIHQDTTILAWAKVASDGTLTRGANIKSCTRVGAGEYAIEIQSKPPNMTAATVSLNDVATSRGKIYVLPDNGGLGLITVYTDSSSGSPEDHSFTLTVVGG